MKLKITVPTPSAEGEAVSLAATNVAKRVEAAASTTLPGNGATGIGWLCADCGWTVPLFAPDEMDLALEHWRICPSPSVESIEKRERAGMDPNVIPLSPSRLITFKSCKRKEWFSSKDPNRVKMAAGDPADLGTAIHTYAETGEDPPATLPLSMADDWPWMKRTIDRFKDNLKGIGEYAEFREHMMRIDYPLADGRVVRLVGKADRVIVWADASIEVWDFKSGRVVLASDEIEDDNQTHDYLVGIKRDFPFGTRFRFHQAQLRFGEIESTDWITPQTIELWDKLLALQAQEYADEKLWKPSPGKQCGYCEFAHRCPAGQAWAGEGVTVTLLEGPVVIESDEDLQRAHDIVTRTAPVVKDLKERIEKYIERHGPTNVEGGRYDVVTAERIRLKDKPAGFKRLVAKLGTEKAAWELFNYNHTSGGKYLEPEGKDSDPILAKNTYTFREDSIKFVKDKPGKKPR